MYESVVCEHMPKTVTARNKATNWNKGCMLGKNKFSQENGSVGRPATKNCSGVASAGAYKVVQNDQNSKKKKKNSFRLNAVCFTVYKQHVGDSSKRLKMLDNLLVLKKICKIKGLIKVTRKSNYLTVLQMDLMRS